MHDAPQAPRTDDAGIESRIMAAGKTAPRIKLADIEACIAGEVYYQPEGTSLTICVLTLRNGFNVIGESAAASVENFDKKIGEDLARAKAKEQIWKLEGYLLRERLSQRGSDAEVERIARMCHEVNRAYCAALGDMSQPVWEDAPDWQKKSAMTGVRLHLANHDAGPQASHESWLAEKVADGWVFGATKDPEAKTHPCIVPFDQLPPAQQAKDFIFRAVVLAAED